MSKASSSTHPAQSTRNLSTDSLSAGNLTTNNQTGGNLILWVRRSLSTQLLVITVLVVLLTEILIMIPSVANQHHGWLRSRMDAAFLVGLALGDQNTPETDTMMVEKVFASADILGATISTDQGNLLKLSPKLGKAHAQIKHDIDLEGYSLLSKINDAWATMFSTGNDFIRIKITNYGDNSRIRDIIVSRADLRSDLRTYSRNILGLSLLISAITAMSVFAYLNRLIISPVKHLRENMAAFEIDPENPANVMKASGRVDEIGDTERDLTALENRLQALLNERRRLAALGAGISKISHDLRNILASAQLMSDRLMNSDDPRVKKLSPRLVDALDRAITLSRDTLSYGKIAPDTLNRSAVNMSELIESVFDDTASMYVEMISDIPEELTIKADRTQLHRALTNLVKNSVEAMTEGIDQDEPPSCAPSHRLTLVHTLTDTMLVIAITDTGPGLPDGAKEFLYEPFKGSYKPGGSGLGVAITAEIIRAHGGELSLIKSDETGASFQLTLPVA